MHKNLMVDVLFVISLVIKQVNVGIEQIRIIMQFLVSLQTVKSMFIG